MQARQRKTWDKSLGMRKGLKWMQRVATRNPLPGASDLNDFRTPRILVHPTWTLVQANCPGSTHASRLPNATESDWAVPKSDNPSIQILTSAEDILEQNETKRLRIPNKRQESFFSSDNEEDTAPTKRVSWTIISCEIKYYIHCDVAKFMQLTIPIKCLEFQTLDVKLLKILNNFSRVPLHSMSWTLKITIII